MHRKISDEEKRLRSINTYVVLFVFFIMVSAGVICVLIFNILDAFGLMKHIGVVPMLLPFIMLCACIIIGSILSAMLSGILLRSTTSRKVCLKYQRVTLLYDLRKTETANFRIYRKTST